MGLLDDFSAFVKTPEGQGLLSGVSGWAAGAQRGTPFNNIGRGGIAGLTGYMNATENGMSNELKRMQIDKYKSDLAIEDAKANAFKTALSPQSLQPSFTPAPTSSMFNGGTAVEASNAQAPTWAQQPVAPQPAPMAPQGQPKLSDVYLSAAKAATDPRASMNLYAQAQAALKEEKALLPKVNRMETRLVNGKPTDVIVFEDGSTKFADGFSPIDKTEYQDLGGSIRAKSGLTGAFLPNSDIKKTATISDNLASQRLNFDKSQVGKPTFHDGAWVYKPTPENPLGTSVKIPGFEKSGNPSEGERKAATLLKRMEGSLSQLNQAVTEKPAAAGPEFLGTTLGVMPLIGDGAKTFVNSNERNRVEAAQLDILDAALTLGTGAAYTKEQLEGYRKAYFPQVGDGDAEKADKKARLENVIEAGRIAAGRAAPNGVPAEPKRDAVGKLGDSMPKIKNDSDYAKLPAGTEFIDPFGQKRRKP